MSDVLDLITRYERWIYFAVGVVALLAARVWWAAAQRADLAPFGMEKQIARSQQAAAGFLFLLLLALAGSMFVFNRYIGPILEAAQATLPPELQPTAIPTATPIVSDAPIVVDSRGCQKDSVNLTRPAPNETLTGGYAVQGTASLPNFAFYRLEISSAATNGAWATLRVENVPIINGPLGHIDTTPYQPGEYAFRLMVTDRAGQAAPPCVIVVNFGGARPTPMEAP